MCFPINWELWRLVTWKMSCRRPLRLVITAFLEKTMVLARLPGREILTKNSPTTKESIRMPMKVCSACLSKNII